MIQPGAIHYARSGDGTHIAWQEVGDGPVDLMAIPPGVSHLEMRWEHPGYADVMRRLASFSRLLMLDKRGSGLSDRGVSLPTTEEQVEDIRAVLDAASSKRAFLFGVFDGGVSSLLFAASYPARVRGLVVYATTARMLIAEDYPDGLRAEVVDDIVGRGEQNFGSAESLFVLGTGVMKDRALTEWFIRMLRSGTTPAQWSRWLHGVFRTDIREVLSQVRVPVLVLNRAENPFVPAALTRWLAAHLPDSRYVELPGEDLPLWLGDSSIIVDAIAEFVTGARSPVADDRVLATVLFTDIVGSTARAAEIGDQRWRDLLDSYYSLVRREIARFRGREVKTLGDGFLATFDGPARAIRCACAIRDGVRLLGIEVRVGLHTGECEVMGDDVGGIAVHIGARVAASALPGEVLVSSTVKDLVAGSGLRFADRGTQSLHGVSGEWRLFAVEG